MIRSRRKREVRATTVSVRRMTKRELALGRMLYPVEELQEIAEGRPRTRGDCAGGERPCPYVSCAHHLFLDVTRNGNLKLNFPDLEPDALPHSCTLDVADEGVVSLERTGEIMNLTRERVRQIEVKAKQAMRRDARAIAAAQDILSEDVGAP